MKSLLRLYDFLNRHRAVRVALLVASILLLLLPLPWLSLTEDITDFLPLTSEQRKNTQLYQQLSDADKVVLIFQLSDTTVSNPDILADAIDAFEQGVQTAAPDLLPALTTRVNYDDYMAVLNHIYSHIPYYLTEDDYRRIDSLLAQDNYIAEQVEGCRKRLELPLSGMLMGQITCDPLNLFLPVLTQLMQSTRGLGSFALYDGYMIASDGKFAFAFLTSPYGMNDTKNNALLVQRLQKLVDEVQTAQSDVCIRLHGAPVVAVGNAKQVRHDSAVALGLAIVFILFLLWRALPRKRDGLLILLTVAFGWLMGVSVMALFRHEISLIVLGISSVMVGIAVNYPLHLLAHRKHTASPRETLAETISPLIIGNITTVGAFLALLPLKAVALRDLGLFSAAMLVGTILFTVVFLPHWLPRQMPVCTSDKQLPKAMLNLKVSKPVKQIGVFLLFVLTILFAVFSFQTNFDTDVSHLNYMTKQQRNDFLFFTTLAGQPAGREVYLVAEADNWSEAAEQLSLMQPKVDSLRRKGMLLQQRSVSRFLPSVQEQRQRLARWNCFCEQNAAGVKEQLMNAAEQYGFRDNAFQPFLNLFTENWQVQDYNFFLPVLKTAYRGYYIEADGQFTLVDRLILPDEKVAEAEQTFLPYRSFDMASLNAAVASQLSDNFNYIGLACSLIVFLFLWMAFRSFFTALVAFLPMAVSWAWILGLMAITGISFNIVNIILATFIFGQGDDYTIFITEGQLYERRTGKSMLPQYRQSILLSAAIMFVGIGILVFAKHPAMRSLGEVTLLGMSVVVSMAFLIPPLCFRIYDRVRQWLNKKNK